MTFKKFILSINESVKEISLNRILDKISKRIDLTYGEKSFLDNYEKIDDRDYHMISKESALNIISNLIDSGRRVVCNLKDRDGIIGLDIISIDNNFQDDICILNLKGGEKVKFDDRYLYNIIWDLDKNIYFLEEDSEYFEKIPVNQ